MKKIWIGLLIFCSTLQAESIEELLPAKEEILRRFEDRDCDEQTVRGLWKIVDQKTGMPRCVVAIYEYQDKYYGRIIGTFNKEGDMTETLYDPQDRAAGIIGKPFYCGLDLIWDLKKGSKCKGKIVNPKKGNIYDAELWVEDGNLIVRGKIWFIGKNRTWFPATSDDFPSNFKQPDVTQFVPVIPQVK